MALQAGVNLKARAIELERSASVSLAIELRTVKHVKLLRIDGDLCLALRLRRPPTFDRVEQTRYMSQEGLSSLFSILSSMYDDDPKPERSTDSSGCEAFGSPTAYLCLSFSSFAGCTAAEATLRKFKLAFHRDVLVVNMHGSRHEHVCGGVSHRLPATLKPLTPKDLSDAGDTEYGVAFLLDLLLRHGHLRAADVPSVLGMLRCLHAWGVVDSYQEYLQTAASQLPAFHRCNDGTAVTLEVRTAWFPSPPLKAVYAWVAQVYGCRAPFMCHAHGLHGESYKGPAPPRTAETHWTKSSYSRPRRMSNGTTDRSRTRLHRKINPRVKAA